MQSTIAYRNQSVSLFGLMFCLILLVVSLLYFSAANHNPSAVEGVRSMFDARGKCSKGSSVELFSPIMNTWMYICFHGERASIWVLARRLIDGGADREVTVIPARDMSRPINYITNCISKRGYKLVSSFGELPKWITFILR